MARGRRVRLGLVVLLLGCLSPLVTAASSASAAPVDCSAGGVDGVVACGTFDSDYMRQGLRGETYTVSRFTVGGHSGYLLKTQDTLGRPITARMARTDLASMYRSDAYSIYDAAAVRSGAVQLYGDEYAAMVERPGVPSSVAASTVEEGAGTALATEEGEMASRSFSFSKVLGFAGKAGRLGWNGLAVVSAFSVGMSVGKFVDNQLCSWGVSAECSHSAAKDYPANGDLGVVPTPGFSPQSVTTGARDAAGETVAMIGNTAEPTTAMPAAGSTAAVNPGSVVKASVAFSVAGDGVTVAPEAVCGKSGVTVYSGKPGPQGRMASNSEGVNFAPAGNKLTPGSSYAVTTTKGVSCPSDAGGLQGIAYEIAFTPYGSTTFQQWFVTYWLPGSAFRPADVDADPPRTFVTTNFCGTAGTTTASSPTFHESAGNLPAFPAAPACPSGATLTEIRVQETGGPAVRTVWDYKVPAAVSNFQHDFPQCQSAETACTLDLAKKNASGTYVSCFDHSGLCTGWFSDPDKASEYQCSYGPDGSRQTVALSECNTLAPSFDVDKVAQGIKYADPRDGTIPDSNPEGTIASGTAGNTGSGSDPGTGDGSSPAPVNVDSQGCLPTGFGIANPIEWVLDPVECALKWAFVPDTATVGVAWKSAWGTISAKPPISVVGDLLPFVTHFGSGAIGGCDGQLANFGDGLVIPCAPPGNPGWFTALYVLGEVAIGGATAFGLWHMISDGLANR